MDKRSFFRHTSSPQNINESKSSPELFILFVLAVVVGAVTIYHHEMWRDESQAFLLVRDSKNIGELWQNVRYEGHPFLWHFILFIAYHLFPSIYTIQVVHLLIGLSVIALIIFCSPFSFTEKFLLTFSYFFSFEYLIISRNYSIGIFLLFLAVTLFEKRVSDKSIINAAIILGLCANTNIYALIISCCFFAYFIVASLFIHNRVINISRIFYATIIFVVFLVIALLQIIPPQDRTPKVIVANDLNVRKAEKLSTEMSEVFFYMPDPFNGAAYWGSDIFRSNLFTSPFCNQFVRYLPQLLALTTIVLLLLSIKKKPWILFFFGASVIGLLLFMCFIFDKGLLRHTGAFFVLLVTTLWLYRSSNPFATRSHVHFDYLFKAILLIQFAGSVVAHIYEMQYPFSGAKDAASFLVKTHRNNESIILHPDFDGVALLHYGGIKEVYYGTIKGKGSFIRFNEKRKACSYNDIYAMAVRENIETIILNGKKDDTVMSNIGYQLLYQPSASSSVPDEDFFIYGKK